MTKLQIFRETALPSPLQGYAIYLIAPPTKPDYVEMYVTDATGSKARRVFDEDAIKALIASSLSAAGQMAVVQDINARDSLPNPKGEVYVIDATGDGTVKSGGARYLRHNSQWIKTAETESMDLAVTWAALQDKPASSTAEIDDAVAKRHQHANKTQLDKIGEDDGQLTYNGKAVTTAWASTGW